jgi:hypothetical protein
LVQRSLPDIMILHGQGKPGTMTSSTGDKSLARFLEVVSQNQRANILRFPESYKIIQRIDGCFVDASRNIVDPKPTLVGPFFLRTHYAFKTSAGMSLAGQVVESFVMMRSCLEYAGYALAIFADPKLDSIRAREEVFIRRHFDAGSLKAQKEEFTMSNVRQAISSLDKGLGEIYKSLYERTINYGAHPNPHGMLSAMTYERDGDKSATITTLALTTDPIITTFSMKSVAQVGLTALSIFQRIFAKHFDDLGIPDRIEALRREGL